MFRLLVIFSFLTYNVNGLQQTNGDPDEIIDKLLYAFNDLYSKPISIPGVQVTIDLPLNDLVVSSKGEGLLVNGTDFARLGHAFKSGEETWQASVDVGNISFAFHNFSITIGEETYPASLSFYPYELPVIMRLERNGTACTISSGPFQSTSLPAVKYSIDRDVKISTHLKALCQLPSNQDFIYEYFLQAFFAAVQDPLYLLVKQFKICPELTSKKV